MHGGLSNNFTIQDVGSKQTQTGIVHLENSFKLSIHPRGQKTFLLVKFQLVLHGSSIYPIDIGIPIVLYQQDNSNELALAFAEASYLNWENLPSLEYSNVLSYEHARALGYYFCRNFILENVTSANKIVDKTITKEAILKPLTHDALDILLKKVVHTFDTEKRVDKLPNKSHFQRYLFALGKLLELITVSFINLYLT